MDSMVLSSDAEVAELQDIPISLVNLLLYQPPPSPVWAQRSGRTTSDRPRPSASLHVRGKRSC